MLRGGFEVGKPAGTAVVAGGVPFGGAVVEAATDEVSTDDGALVMARRRRAVMIGLAVLAVLQAADVLLTWALLANDGAELNPVGRALIGSGGAIVAKFSIVAVLFALVRSRPIVRMGFVCGVWAVTGIYVAVVAMNLYSLQLIGGLG
jgi:hypothetical protein